MKRRTATRIKKSVSWLLIIIVTALLVACAVTMFIEQAEACKPDFIIPMANARIEWTGAGYDGIYGR